MSLESNDAERRRLPRVTPAPTFECRIDLKTKVRLLDISLSGALVAVDAPLPIGTRGLMRTGVNSAPFTPEVQVQRTVDGRGSAHAGFGAVFVTMDERSRECLEIFLRKASE
jgi:hypothetical protein